MTAAATSSEQTGSRGPAFAALAVAVTLAHLLALQEWEPAHRPRPPLDGPQPARPVQVRHLPPGPIAAAPVPAPRPAMPPPVSAPAPVPAPGGVLPAPAAPTENAQARDVEDEPTSPPAGGDPQADPPPPVYPTRMPPPQALPYEVRRGALSGEAELRWEPEADRYRLSLRGRGGARPLLDWTSEGGLDEAGVAPERHAEVRRGRELRAANFQRDRARITFSGPRIAHALLPGAQDRLSWIVQLAAVLAADPARTAPGAQTSIFVAGARGDGGVWTFVATGPETLTGPSGEPVATLRLQRTPQRPRDTEVQVWVDPARHHLPVRLVLAWRPGGEGTELRLRDTVAR